MKDSNKRVLTLQDISCFGSCSLTVALPIISACGIETAILPSAVLSTHTGGFTDVEVCDLTDDIMRMVNHWVKENISFDCLYTGYLGSIRQIEYVREIKKKVINRDGIFILDPAMADNGILYKGFDEAYVKAMAGLVGESEVLLPNLTEACMMTGIEYRKDDHDEAYVEEILGALKALGATNVVLKGISFEEGKIGIALCEGDNVQYYFTKRVGRGYHGTGDCFAASFTGALIRGSSMYDAGRIAADFVVEGIRQTLNDDNHPYGIRFERVLPMLIDRLTPC